MLKYDWVEVYCMSEDFARVFIHRDDYQSLNRRFGSDTARNPPKGVMIRNALDHVRSLESQVAVYEAKLRVIDDVDVSLAEDKLRIIADLERNVSELKVLVGL